MAHRQQRRFNPVSHCHHCVYVWVWPNFVRAKYYQITILINKTRKTMPQWNIIISLHIMWIIWIWLVYEEFFFSMHIIICSKCLKILYIKMTDCFLLPLLFVFCITPQPPPRPPFPLSVFHTPSLSIYQTINTNKMKMAHCIKFVYNFA